MTSVGKRIKIQRVKLGLSQEELASKMNLSIGILSKWERDKSEPSFKSTLKLAEALEVPKDYFFYSTPEPNKNYGNEMIEWISFGERLKSKGYDLSEIEKMINNIFITLKA